MAINLDLIRQKLNKLEGKKSPTTNSQANYVWRPREGTTKARIIPIKNHNVGLPFIEAYFHYFKGQTLVSPQTFGNSDLIADFVNNVLNESRDSGNRLSTEEFKRVVKLRPQLRTYAMVIVRGEEELGPRFFGFGKTNYEKLLKTIADPEYGDITDPFKGRDITIEHTPREKSKTGFANTEIMISPSQKPISEDKDYIERVLNNQPVFKECFTAATEEELQDALDRHLGSMDGSTDSSDEGTSYNFEKKSESNDESDESETEPATKPFNMDDFDKMFKD